MPVGGSAVSLSFPGAADKIRRAITGSPFHRCPNAVVPAGAGGVAIPSAPGSLAMRVDSRYVGRWNLQSSFSRASSGHCQPPSLRYRHWMRGLPVTEVMVNFPPAEVFLLGDPNRHPLPLRWARLAGKQQRRGGHPRCPSSGRSCMPLFSPFSGSAGSSPGQPLQSTLCLASWPSPAFAKFASASVAVDLMVPPFSSSVSSSTAMP